MNIIKLKLLKFKLIEIIYVTKNQYWGIYKNGSKQQIGLEVFTIFLKTKFLISYTSSKFIKKGFKFKKVRNTLEINIKTISIKLEILNSSEIVDRK